MITDTPPTNFTTLSKKKFNLVVELVCGGSVINGAYPVYFLKIIGSAIYSYKMHFLIKVVVVVLYLFEVKI